ncbi:MAG: MFS transporter [Proteobacteria bacterium]|nr:MFS transporter [Pseudomonadota bacterium]
MTDHAETEQSSKERASSEQGGMFSSLHFRDFRLLWFGSIAATFAMQMQIVARGWLIYDMTRSPMALTWVMLSFMLPSVVFSLLGGVIADRLHKRSIMIVSGLLNTVATLILAAIVYMGDVTFWHFIYFGVFNGTVLALSMPARASVTPEIVGRDQVVNAMALQSATFNLSRIVGPALAGGLIALAAAGDTSSTQGVGLVFFVVAVLYGLSVFCTTLIHYQGKPHQQGNKPIADLIEGFSFMRREPLVVGLIVMGFVPMTFGFSVTFLLPAFNADILAGGPETLGILVTASGAGALAGSLLLARAGDIGGKGRVMFYAGYLWAIFVAAFALSGSLITAMVFGAATGLAGAVMGSLNMSVVQIALPDEIRGRVMAIMMMAHGFMPLGIIPISIVAENLGIDVALALAAVLLAVSLVILRIWIPGLMTINRGHDD